MKIQHIKTWGKQKNTLKSFTGVEKNNRPRSPPQLGSLSVQFSRSVVSDSLWPHGLQHARLPCPSLSPGACSNWCALSQWCRPTNSSSVTSFSSCLQSFPASRPFPVSRLLASGGLSTGTWVSTWVLPMNVQAWFPLLIGLIALQSKGLSRVFSSTTVRKHQFFGA